jgi:peroxiredoxin
MAKIPFIKELHKLYSSRGLVVIGVHTEVAQEKIPAFISDEEINYIIAVDSNGLNAKSYNIFSYPTTVLIDSEGIIRAINPDEIELKNLLKAYLK